MNISEVKFYPFNFDKLDCPLWAYATVTIDFFIMIKNFRVLVAKNSGVFISFPLRNGTGSKLNDLAEFKSAELKLRLRSSILEAYKVYY
jgi:DNA-binding cell septation regulator SpoVG